ncbi:hypothetical protein [Streptomyces sp. NPDC020571]
MADQRGSMVVGSLWPVGGGAAIAVTAPAIGTARVRDRFRGTGFSRRRR